MRSLSSITKPYQDYVGPSFMLSRRSEFSSRQQALLAGIGMDQQAKEEFNLDLDCYVFDTPLPAVIDELIIGGGVHAATYASALAALGRPMPVVVEPNVVGGAFACSEGPSFWLNSRNRPGELGIPGEARGLNVIPGAMLQPFMLSDSEYQRNSDLAFCIRVALAQNAIVSKATVTAVRPIGDVIDVDFVDFDGKAYSRSVRRVIDARGLGTIALPPAASQYVLSFEQFMASLDGSFPLKGVKRAAVLGRGDSGKCAIEALIGQSPAQHFSTSLLDHVDQVDWYDRDLPTVCASFVASTRPRYAKIGPFLSNRITVRQQKGAVATGFQGAFVNERPYDLVIVATSRTKPAQLMPTAPLNLNGVAVGAQAPSEPYYIVGPSAGLDYSPAETALSYASRPENKVAIFRLAARTAALAASLPPLPKLPKAPAKGKVAAKPSPLAQAEILGVDKDGKPLRTGDRVTVENTRKDFGGGTIVDNRDPGQSMRFPYAVKLDSGEVGSGVGRSFRCEVSTVTKIEAEAESEVTGSLGVDLFGMPFYAGDRLFVGEGGTGEQQRRIGKALAYKPFGSTTRAKFSIKREDGAEGGDGIDKSWILPVKGLTVVKLSDGPIIGYDKNGLPIQAGDRITVYLSDSGDVDEASGTAVDEGEDPGSRKVNDTERVSLNRDDDMKGGGIDGAWVLTSDEYESIERIKS